MEEKNKKKNRKNTVLYILENNNKQRKAIIMHTSETSVNSFVIQLFLRLLDCFTYRSNVSLKS